MNTYGVSYQMAGSDRWYFVGDFKAKSEAGAIQQFARDLRHFPYVVAVRATKVL